MKTAEASPVFSASILKKFAAIAVPSILQQSFISVGNICIQGIINGFGTAVMAGYSAAVKLNNLVITSFTTLGNGVSNYTAQNLGARKLSRIKAGFAGGLKMVWTLCLPICLLYGLAAGPLLRFFIEEPTAEAVRTGVLFLRIVSPFFFVISAKHVADGILRGAGMMRQFMAATFTNLALRVGVALVLSATSLGAVGIWCAWPMGWTAAAALSILFYRSGQWNN